VQSAVACADGWLAFQKILQRIPGFRSLCPSNVEILMVESYGCADGDAGVALTIEHLFRVASHSNPSCLELRWTTRNADGTVTLSAGYSREQEFTSNHHVTSIRGRIHSSHTPLEGFIFATSQLASAATSSSTSSFERS